MRQPWYPLSANTLTAACRMARRFSGSLSSTLAGRIGCGGRPVRGKGLLVAVERSHRRARGQPELARSPRDATALGDRGEIDDEAEARGGIALVEQRRDARFPAAARRVPHERRRVLVDVWRG